MPEWGTEFGGAIVHVVGTNFDSEVLFACLFGTAESTTPAIVINT